MLVTKTIEIDMGHRVPNHKSKCRNLHGHRYKIEVGVDDKVIIKKGESNEGMVIDFSDLKNIMMKVIDEELDHGFMLYQDDPFIEEFSMFKHEGMKIIFVTFIPTVENISRWLYYKMKSKLQTKGIKISYIKIWETPNSTATFTENDVYD